MPGFPQLVLVCGPDSFMMEEEAEAVLDEIAPDWRENEFKVQKVPGLADRVDDAIDALNAVRSAMGQQGFFASDPVVWLRDLSFSQAPQAKDRTSDSPAVKDALDAFCESLEKNGVPQGVTLLVTGTTIGKNTKFYKLFDRLSKAKPARAKIVACAGGSADAARRLLERKLAENKRSMSPETRTAFLDRVGTEGAAIAQELEKLFTYTGGKEPKPEDVAAICTLAHDGVVWELLNAFGHRDLAKCMAVTNDLLSGRRESEVVGLTIMLESRLSDLELAVGAREKNLLSEDGRSWSPGLEGEDCSAVGALGKYDIFAKPSLQKAPVLEQARKWNSRQMLRARMALMEMHERLTSAGLSPRMVFDIGLSKALSG